MMEPWNGKGGWVWYVRQCGGTARMIELAQACDLDYLIIKYSDGDGFGDQRNPGIFHDQFTAAANSVKAAGLRLLAYSYIYGGSPSRSPEDEAEIVATAVSAGADAIVFDAEYEYINRIEAAARFFDALMPKLPADYPLALSTDLRILVGNAPAPWSATSVDLTTEPWPWKTFFGYCQALMPEFYWDDWDGTPAGTFALLSALGNAERAEGWKTPTIIPTLPGNSATSDLAAALGLCSTLKVSGINVWRLDTLRADSRALVRTFELGGEMTDEEKKKVLTHLAVLWGEMETVQKAADELKSAVLATAAAGLRERIIAVKATLGLS